MASLADRVEQMKVTQAPPRERKPPVVKFTVPASDAVPVKAPTPNGGVLTDSEVRCLQAIAAGNTYDEAALALGVATSTVRTHLHNIYGKLGVSNSAQAVLRAVDQGLLKREGVVGAPAHAAIPPREAGEWGETQMPASPDGTNRKSQAAYTMHEGVLRDVVETLRHAHPAPTTEGLAEIIGAWTHADLDIRKRDVCVRFAAWAIHTAHVLDERIARRRRSA